MPIFDQNKQATDDASVIQLEDASSGNTLGVTAANEAKVSVTQPLPSGTNSIGSIVNVSGAVSLPTGASTSALQTTGNNSLSSIDGKTPALGQALAAASVPVVLTLAQLSTLTPLTTIAATQSGTWNINNISGTISLPTGASTSALQSTGNTSLATIVTNTAWSTTGSSPTSATIGLTSGTVIASNSNRKGLVLTNTSSLATVSLHLANGSAVLNTGIMLYPHDSWEMGQFTFTTAQINAISSLAGTVIAIQEMT